MKKIDDIRETRVYKDAMEEGRQEVRQQLLHRDREAIIRMADLGISPEKIAEILKVDLNFVRSELARLEEKLRAIPKMASKNLSADDIADILDLEIDFVRNELGKQKYWRQFPPYHGT